MEGYHFRNWARTYECKPEKYFEPASEDELRAIVRQANGGGGGGGKKIRMVGYGHSPSDLCCTDGYMIRLNKMNRVLEVDTDKATVTVQAGVMLNTLVQVLKDDHNLALPVLPSTGDFTLAGLISTSVHGSGAECPVLADAVLELSLLTADDRVLVCSREGRNERLFRAVCGGLGSLGVILTLKIQCQPYYHVRHVRYPMRFDQFVQLAPDLCRESTYFKANYFPYTDYVAVYSMNRCRPSVQEVIPDGGGLWAKLLVDYVLPFGLLLTQLAPWWLVGWVNRLAYWALYAGPEFGSAGYERVFFFDCRYHQYVSEWAVPRERCGEALRRLRDAIERQRLPAHFFAEIRFIGRDEFWLSPAYERDVCAINVVMYCPYDRRPDTRRYWAAVAEIMMRMDGRPHLAKDHPMTRADMIRAYPKFKDFDQLRRELDPRNLFMNTYLQRVFKNSEE